ncbi:MAG: di-heme oxidoredictase family protein [bacterium]
MGDAMAAELGLTLPEEAGSTFARTEDDDDTPDPELSLEQTRAMELFLNQQAPPAPVARHPDAEVLFMTIGCGDCHVPKLAGLAGDINAYTDLLLHVVAEDGSPGIEDGMATIHHFRTPPLWGLRFTAPYMHSGTAMTIEEAILAHHGEGSASRQGFLDLAADQKAAFLGFLGDL